VRPEFLIFGATLCGIALFHRHALLFALLGLGALIVFKVLGPGFAAGTGMHGLAIHFTHEAPTLVNLLFLLVGFAVIARHFEDSHLPLLLPRYLPDGWTGGLSLLAIVFVLSSFLDNIAAALIGGAMAHALFRGRLHVGYLAAIVAASNAGGAGSVIGDTTTTMMWISGIAPHQVVHAYIGSAGAMMVCGIPAALLQQRYAPIMKLSPPRVRIDWARLGIVAITLASAALVNLLVNAYRPELAERFPVIGGTVAAVLAVTFPIRKPNRSILGRALLGSVFLLALVASASLMPVGSLPSPSSLSTFALGMLSAVFDNIPLTALALRQGHYDWGMLAYAVGFGGSMIWFGSSAGVALTAQYTHARSTLEWVRQGWPVMLGYCVGFLAMLSLP
jgi:Na+/H+ antiporter NhaD/arsenite permease-like protein